MVTPLPPLPETPVSAGPRRQDHEQGTGHPGRRGDPNLSPPFRERYHRFSTGMLTVLNLNNLRQNSQLLRLANMYSQFLASKPSGSHYAPPMLPPKEYHFQMRTGSNRCPHQSWRSPPVRPSIEITAYVLDPDGMGIRPKSRWIGKQTKARPSPKFTSSRIPPGTRAGASSRFRRAFGV